jgi:hypothetical protein
MSEFPECPLIVTAEVDVRSRPNGARPHDPAIAAGAGGSGDRMMPPGRLVAADNNHVSGRRGPRRLCGATIAFVAVAGLGLHLRLADRAYQRPRPAASVLAEVHALSPPTTVARAFRLRRERRRGRRLIIDSRRAPAKSECTEQDGGSDTACHGSQPPALLRCKRRADI